MLNQTICEFKCNNHDIATTRICTNIICSKNIICTKCKNYHINDNKHELVSIDEFITRYYSKIKNMYDLNKFPQIFKNVSKINIKFLKKRTEMFNISLKSTIEKRLNRFLSKIIQTLNLFKNSRSISC